MGKRPELEGRAARRVNKLILSTTDVCILCGHPGADAIDHVIPPKRGGDKYSIENKAPIHGVKGCPYCGRKCNNEKSDRLLTEIQSMGCSRDWWVRDE